MAKILSYLVPLVAGHEYVLDYLQENGLIAEENGEFCISALGKLSLNLYLFPDEVFWSGI